jgi:hypothetical protein
MFWLSAKEEVRRRLKIEQQLELLKEQERRKKEREAIRATWPWWRKQPILIAFLCLCTIYILSDNSDNKKVATQATSGGVTAAVAEPSAKPAAIAETDGQIATLKKGATGCKSYDDFIELRALQFDKFSVAQIDVKTKTAKEIKHKKYAELRQKEDAILKERCQVIQPGGVFLIEMTDMISGPYEIKDKDTGVTYYLPGSNSDKFELK